MGLLGAVQLSREELQARPVSEVVGYVRCSRNSDEFLEAKKDGP